MNDLWFSPAHYSWLPGTVLGCMCGLWGALVGILGPRGKAKLLVVWLGRVLFASSLFLLVAGGVAFVSGQPYGIWYGLGLPGMVGTIVIGCNLPMLTRVYRQAEERRISAQDLT